VQGVSIPSRDVEIAGHGESGMLRAAVIVLASRNVLPYIHFPLRSRAMMRRAPPPDFRYVWLAPGPSSTALALGAGIVGVAGVDAALWSVGHEPITLGLTFLGGAAFALTFLRNGARLPKAAGARAVAMAVVPWGVIVEPDAEPRVLRWSAIRKISISATHAMNGGTPAVVASIVTVETEHERLAGCAPGAIDLESLTVHCAAYAEESAMPVARDLDGMEPCEGGATEPVVGELLREAEELCTTSRGAARLHLPPGGYRTLSTRAAAPETLALLRGVLGASDGVGAADARPLAALVAGLLGASELLPDLLRLINAPHPLVAAVAKAAALRLGAPQSRAGAVDEVSAFLFEEDTERLTQWSAGVVAKFA